MKRFYDFGALLMIIGSLIAFGVSPLVLTLLARDSGFGTGVPVPFYAFGWGLGLLVWGFIMNQTRGRES